MMPNTSEQPITVVQTPELGNTGPAILLTFAMLCILIWANLIGFLGEGGSLVIGCVQLGAFPAFLASAIILIKKGLSFEENVFLIFNAMFCGSGAAFNLISALAEAKGVAYAPKVMGIVWLICGVYLLLMLAPVRQTPAANFFSFLFCGVSLVVLGLITMGLLSARWNPLAAWAMLLSGLCALWMSITGISAFAGICLPAGPALFKK